MHITRPKQALCSDRSKLTVGVNPDDWIFSSLPEDSSLVSFHFFVNWANSPPTVGKDILLTRLIHFGAHESHTKIDKSALLDLFLETERHQFEVVERVCRPHGQRVFAVLLPEIPMAEVNNQTPIWLVLRNAQDFKLVARDVEALRGYIQRESGGAVKVGSKGLTYGTSAIECFLSTTDAAYPGDVDAVACDSEGRIYFVVEYKKHNLDAPIQDHLADKYYPWPDGRKYQRLDVLLCHYRAAGNYMPFVILYYSTKTPTIRIQIIGKLLEEKMIVEKDSGDLNISGLSSEEVGAAISEWIGGTK